jgi:hypothetical protein
VGAIVGVAMLIFGIFFFASRGSSMPGPFLLFGGVWILLVIVAIAYNVINAASPKGLPTQIIEAEDNLTDEKPVAARLQELEDLRNRKLISDSEYEAKRQEILKQL